MSVGLYTCRFFLPAILYPTLYPTYAMNNKRGYGNSVTPGIIWWRIPGSNRWPADCEPAALPTELIPHRACDNNSITLKQAK